MQFLSNQQIINILNQRPGRLIEFLLQVPINQLRDALQQSQRRADLRFRDVNNRNPFRQNVLDFPLKTLIRRCFDEGILNWFQLTLNLQRSRIQNHSQFGRRLVQRRPQQYYIGQRSGHYNHAREIQQSYGIVRPQEQPSQNENNQQPNNQQNQSDQGDDFINDNEQDYISQNSVEEKIDQLDQKDFQQQKQQENGRKRKSKKIQKPKPKQKADKKKTRSKKTQKKEEQKQKMHQSSQQQIGQQDYLAKYSASNPQISNSNKNTPSKSQQNKSKTQKSTRKKKLLNKNQKQQQYPQQMKQQIINTISSMKGNKKLYIDSQDEQQNV